MIRTDQPGPLEIAAYVSRLFAKPPEIADTVSPELHKDKTERRGNYGGYSTEQQLQGQVTAILS
jgi:hypothetical protein